MLRSSFPKFFSISSQPQLSKEGYSKPTLPVTVAEKEKTQKEHVKYNTQLEILTDMGKDPDIAGICAQLTSAFAYDRITGQDNFGKFVEGPKDEVHENISKLQAKSEALRLRGYSPDKMAFHLARTPFTKKTLYSSQITEQNFADSLGKHSLVTYPTRRGHTHVVYFGKENEMGKCTFFDSNRNGFTQRDSCRSLVSKFLDSYRRNPTRQRDWIEVASSAPSMKR